MLPGPVVGVSMLMSFAAKLNDLVHDALECGDNALEANDGDKANVLEGVGSRPNARERWFTVSVGR